MRREVCPNLSLLSWRLKGTFWSLSIPCCLVSPRWSWHTRDSADTATFAFCSFSGPGSWFPLPKLDEQKPCPSPQDRRTNRSTREASQVTESNEGPSMARACPHPPQALASRPPHLISETFFSDELHRARGCGPSMAGRAGGSRVSGPGAQRLPRPPVPGAYQPAQGRGTAGSPSCCPRLLPAAGRERLVPSQGEGGGSTRPESRASSGDFRLYPEWSPQPSLAARLRAAAHTFLSSLYFASFAEQLLSWCRCLGAEPWPYWGRAGSRDRDSDTEIHRP